jgi:peptidoglycan/xylan/chitin deacetylase (PgdA/CDA1 family)
MSTGAVSRRTLEWPGEQRFYLTIDFECDYGTALPENQYHAVTRVDELIDVLAGHEIPLTAFVQTEVFDRRPDAVEKLRAAPFPVEFYPHSHTHPKRSEASVSEEVTTSTERFEDFFGARPAGYRFPNGNVRPDDYELLAAAGYDFDASVFPSWRPGHFDNSSEPTTPHLLEEYDLLEIPFTVLSDRLRIPTALSYCRLGGRPLLAWLAANPPSTIVFNIHMHDLFNPPSFDRLPRRYRAIYARNADRFGMLERVLASFSDTGFAFEPLSTVYEDLIGER